MIKGPHAVACPEDFILRYYKGQQRAALKFMKNDYFLVFSAVRVIFLTFLGM